MADEIVSSLGFTVTDALAALSKLDAMFKSTFASMANVMTNWNTQAKSTVKAINSIATAVKQAQAAMASMKVPNVVGKTPAAVAPTVGANIGDTATKIRGVKDETEKADKATQSWVLSWKTMGRVVTTQLIVRTLSQIRNALGEAIQGAVDFQTRIAEIRTIAPEMDRDFNALGREVSDLATKFNFPLPQAAEAVYQALSNQFTTVAQRSDIMRASAELAKVGVMSLSDAVLLITGTLNAYGQSSSQAETVAAKFFNTIRLGRIRGEELVQVVGKLYPMSAALGVSLESVNSELIGLTIGGMKSSEASTALRGAMTALLKPSEALKKELANLGYETGPQIISALGLQGAFLKLGESADGDVQKLATLFRQVRGLNAELRLTGPGAIKASEAFDVLSQSTAELVRGVYEQFRTTEAHKFTDSLNQIKVYLSTELGPALISSFNAIARFAGGADTLKAAFTSLMIVGVPVVGMLALMAATLLVVSANARLAGTSVSWMTTALRGLALPLAAIGTISFVNEKTAYDLRAASAEVDKIIADRAAKQQDAIDAENKAIQKQTDTQISELEKRASAARKIYNEMVSGVHEANAQLISNNKSVMEAMISDRERVAGIYRALSNNEIQESRKATKASIAAEAEYADSVFNFAHKHADAWTKVMDYSRKARAEAYQAAREMSAAKSPEAHEEAAAKFARAAADAQTAMSSAAGNSFLEEEAQRAILGILRQKGVAEKAYSATALQSSRAASKAAADEQVHVNNMKALMPKLLKDMDLFKKGAPKSPADRAKLVEDTKKDIDAFQKEWMTSGKLSTSEFLNWTELKEKLTATMEGGVSDVQIQGFFATPESLSDLNKQITEGVGPIKALVVEAIANNPALAKKVAKQTAPEGLDTVVAAAKTGVKSMADFKEKTDEVAKSERVIRDEAVGIVTEMVTFEDSYKGVAGAIRTATAVAGQFFSEVMHWQQPKQVQELWSDAYTRIAIMAQKPALVTKKNVAELESEIETLKGIGVLPTANIDLLDKQLVRIKAIQAAREKIDATKPIINAQRPEVSIEGQRTQEIMKSGEAVDALKNKTSDAAEQTKSIQTAADTAKTSLQQLASVDFSGLLNQLSQSASAMSALSQTPMTASKGGVAYLASGGRGTDTISALLSPGEMVMNAAASNKFATQLSAMNAGIQPTYNQESRVTNVGDINISVNGGKTGQATVREIAAGLRREVRRGTIF